MSELRFTVKKSDSTPSHSLCVPTAVKKLFFCYCRTAV